jgi:hypothetical protein
VSNLSAHGVSVVLPSGWEGRIFRRLEAGEARRSEVAGAAAPAGEQTFAVAQMATIPVPADAADFGSELVEDLHADDVFVVLKEYAPVLAQAALFSRAGLPRRLEPADFDDATLQRRIDGQGGYQAFFHDAGRAFCLYIVLGDFSRRRDVLPGVNEVLARISIGPLPSDEATPQGAP